MDKRDPYDIRGLYVTPQTRRRSDRRVTDHRCGRCSYDGTGRADCPRRFEDPDVARDNYVERVQERLEADMDRELGADPWSR